jgi:hypothetical protein
MVSSLEPDWGVVNPLAYLRVAEERQGKKSPLVGWITYLAASPDSISSLPLPARVTPMGKQGALIVITDERFTASNIAHVEAADNVALALDQAGLRE